MFIAYQISTEHVQALRRWQSYKAYWILNALEIVFWAAVTFLVMQANLARCVGVGCKLSWVVMALSIILRYVPGCCLAQIARCARTDLMIVLWRPILLLYVSWITARDATLQTIQVTLTPARARAPSLILLSTWLEMRHARLEH